MDDQQIIQTLEQHGGSLRDYFLVGEPPAISRWTPQGNLYGLIIDDDALYRECVGFLKRHGACFFASPDEAMRAFNAL
jgi:hypothetical protein